MKTFFNKKKSLLISPISSSAIYVFLSIVLLVITLLPLFILCLYNHPQSLDNYRTYYFYEQNGFNYNILQKLLPGTRFIGYLTSTPLLKIPQTLTIKNIDSLLAVYRLFSIFMIAIFCFSFLFFTWQINRFYFKLPNSSFIFLYSLLLFIVINSLKRIDLFFYEMVTSAGYTTGLILFFIYVGFLIQYYHEKKILDVLLSSVLVFLLCGTIEYFTVLTGYIAFIFLIIRFIKEKRTSIPVLLHLVYCLIVFYLFVRSPSNASKIAGYSGGIANPYSLDRFMQWLRNMNHELCNTFSYLLQRKILPALIMVAVLLRKKIVFFNRYIFLFIALNYAVCAVMAFAIFISGISDFTWAPSTIQIPYVIMIMNTFLLLLCAVSVLLQKYKIIFTGKGKNLFHLFTYSNVVSVTVALFYLVFISVARPGLPVRQAWKDILKGTARRYDTQVHQLYTEIKNSPDDIVTINEITDVPLTLITSNITSNLWTVKGTYSYQKEYYTNALAPFFFKKDIIITGYKRDE